MCMYINLCFQDISRTQKENIFAQSTLSAELWGNFVEVMNLYEDGELKDQNKCGEVKQHHFQPICRLPVVTQQELLQLLIDKTISVKEMKVKADDYRQHEMMKKAFVRGTNSRNWESASSRYPHFADRLHQFSRLKFNKPQLPETFVTFCQAAIDSKHSMHKYDVHVSITSIPCTR